MRSKLILIFIISILSLSLKADLSRRLEIEKNLKETVEQALKINDKTARVTLSLNYKTIEMPDEGLPGLTDQSSKAIISPIIDLEDINKISVIYYSENAELQKSQSSLIYSLLPLSKQKISLSLKQILSEKSATPLPPPITEKDLRSIATESVRLLSLFVGGSLSLILFLLGLVILFTSARMRSVLKNKSFSVDGADSGTSSFASSSSSELKNSNNSNSTDRNYTSLVSGEFQIKQIQQLSDNSIEAIISDLYWCEMDAEACYLWNYLSSQQKSKLLENVNFLNLYSLYFFNFEPAEFSLWQHPYYTSAQKMSTVSQNDLQLLVQKKSELWNLLSPLRQMNLDLSVLDKIKFSKSKNNLKNLSVAWPVSSLRQLDVKSYFGDLTIKDEETLLNEVMNIPKNLAQQLPSLIWLNSCDQVTAENILAKFDAKNLASAWIGPEAVLSRLNEILPMKKRELLNSYFSKSKPSKNNQAFNELWILGLEHFFNSTENSVQSIKSA